MHLVFLSTKFNVSFQIPLELLNIFCKNVFIFLVFSMLWVIING